MSAHRATTCEIPPRTSTTTRTRWPPWAETTCSRPLSGTSTSRPITITPSDFYHDFRHRRTGTVEWIDVSQGKFLFTSQTFDNNDNVTQVQQFNSTTDTTDTTAIVRQSGTSFDYLQRPYQTQRAGVNALTAQYLFSEGSGSSTADNSGNGYTAALEGAAGWGRPARGAARTASTFLPADTSIAARSSRGRWLPGQRVDQNDVGRQRRLRPAGDRLAHRGDDVGRPGRLDAAR